MIAEAAHLFDEIQEESAGSERWLSIGNWARDSQQHAAAVAGIPDVVVSYFRRIGELLPATGQFDIVGAKALVLERETAEVAV